MYGNYDNLSPELKYAMEHSRDEGAYPIVFDKDAGFRDTDDCFIPEHPDFHPVREGKYAGKDEKGNPIFKPQVKLDISSFRGISIGAIHYYGKLKADGIKFVDGEGNGHFGYLGESVRNWPKEKQDLYDSSYHIEIVRPVTQEEIDKDPMRWDGYCAGWETNGFESIEEIKKIAQKVFKARFPEGWEGLIIDINC